MDWRQLWCSRLERNALKKARSVPRGERTSNSPDLPDNVNSIGIRLDFAQAGVVKMPLRLLNIPLLQKLHIFKQVVEKWLKAGVIIKNRKHCSVKGIPQGGIISHATDEVLK
jgi:hypothetical protein